MPYIITTKRPTRASQLYGESAPLDLSRRAVATLEEAVDLTIDLGWNPANSRATMGRFLLSAGKTPPLPDGTVIEVQEIAWFKLAIACDKLYDWNGAADTTNVEPVKAEIVAAFNAQETS